MEENLREIIRDHTAGDPTQEGVVWTYLSPPEIAQQLETQGTPVCADTVRDLLDELGFVQRKAQKRIAMGATPFRNEQFENIARLKAEYLDSDNPILSMDTKKKNIWAISTGRGSCTPQVSSRPSTTIFPARPVG